MISKLRKSRLLGKLKQRDFLIYVIVAFSGALFLALGNEIQDATGTDVNYTFFGLILMLLALLMLYSRGRR